MSTKIVSGVSRLSNFSGLMLLALLSALCPSVLSASDPLGPEATLRLIVQANADRDLATMSKYMSHDADAVGYTIDGHKYVGWEALEAEMRAEFNAVAKLELPITSLQLWRKDDIAWFAMELDYIRYPSLADPTQRIILPLRETGVLEQQSGGWTLVAWHESVRQAVPAWEAPLRARNRSPLAPSTHKPSPPPMWI